MHIKIARTISRLCIKKKSLRFASILVRKAQLQDEIALAGYREYKDCFNKQLCREILRWISGSQSENSVMMKLFLNLSGNQSRIGMKCSILKFKLNFFSMATLHTFFFNFITLLCEL